MVMPTELPPSSKLFMPFSLATSVFEVRDGLRVRLGDKLDGFVDGGNGGETGGGDIFGGWHGGMGREEDEGV